MNETFSFFLRMYWKDERKEEEWGMDRPVLKLPRTKWEWGCDILGLIVFIGSIIFLVVSWSAIPEQVPGHYNASGEVDRWGSKYELFILPMIGVFLWFMMGLFERFPHIHNYPARINESNAAAFYLTSRKMLNVTKNICLALFGFILIQSIRVALGWADSLGIWFLPVFLLATIVPIIFALIKFSRIQ